MLSASGAASGTVTDNYWFRYDSLNRLITDKGSLSGTAGAATTTIVRGNTYAGSASAQGQDYVYDAAGQRMAAIRTEYSPGSYSYYYGYYAPGYYYETRENYDYDGAGRLADIRTTQGAGVDDSAGVPTSVPAASASGGVTRSLFTYDLMGRQTAQTDYDAAGTTVIYSRSASYLANGFLSSDSATTKKYESNYTTNLYRSDSTYSATSSTGEYLNGAVGSVSVSNYKNGAYQNASSTTNSYVWWDSALQGSVTYKPNTSQSTTYTTSFGYDGQGALSSVSIQDGRPRSVSYVTNGDGQIVRRDEADNIYFNSTTGLGGDPHEVWYRFAGKELGYVGNNGTTSALTANASIADRQTFQDAGAFRNGAKYASTFTEFAESTGAQINSYSQGSAAGSYVVQRSGESLRSIAQQLWGDASLWYKLADANGMSGDVSLAEGQRLTLPSGLQRTHNNASTLNPYDANAAIGNVSPTTPKPPKKNGCGIVGMILLAAIAIAVAVFLPVLVPALAPTALGGGVGGAILSGAIGAAAGSVVSQGVGVATGIQDKFSFKNVALAAIGGAVGGGLGASGLFGQTIGKTFTAGSIGIRSAIVNAAVQGAAGSVITQGIGVATGLQDKFSWAGVAAAGIGAGVSSSLGDALHLKPLAGAGSSGSFGNIAGQALAGTAGALANAATRSAIEGSDFGDNIMAALPDALGSVIGQALGGAVMKRVEAEFVKKAEAKADLLMNENYDAISPLNQAGRNELRGTLAGLIMSGSPDDKIVAIIDDPNTVLWIQAETQQSISGTPLPDQTEDRASLQPRPKVSDAAMAKELAIESNFIEGQAKTQIGPDNVLTVPFLLGQKASFRIRGATPLIRIEYENALKSVLSTSTGHRMALLVSLSGEHQIVLGTSGPTFGRKELKTVYVNINENDIEYTTRGLRSSTPVDTLAHELGHSVFGFYDFDYDGKKQMENVTLVENPIRRELGLPLRTRYEAYTPRKLHGVK